MHFYNRHFMNRIIKFRVWDRKRIDYNPKIGYSEGTYDYPINEELNSDGIFMQFTGLRDSNGKEIYEGDIVEYDEEITKLPNKWVVKFSNGTFALYDPNCCEDCKNGNAYNIPFSEIWSKSINVIGNIFENPNLIK